MTTKFWPEGRRAPLPPTVPWSGQSEELISAADSNWRTPSEAAGFEETPTYLETLKFLQGLSGASSLIRLEHYGDSVEGQPLTLVIASLDHAAASGPRLAGSRARVLTQCGIHPGEIDGKDAGLMLLRDIASQGREDLLAGADWFFVPVVNPDGHERRSAFNRPNQRGPEEQGWRASAQGLNLNRDFIKLDSPEIRSIVQLINKLTPDLFVDMHVTDGLDYQYDITFGFQDQPYALSPAINAWLEEHYRPAVDANLRFRGHIPGPLVLALDDRHPELGLTLPAFPPRFSHSYGDARHLATVLVENHSLKPVRQRILGTYALLEASLAVASAKVGELRRATVLDEDRRDPRPILTWEEESEPVRHVVFHGIASEFYPSMASGSHEVRWLGVPSAPVQAPLFGSKPGEVIDRPIGYWVPSSEPDVIDRLGRHGVLMRTADEAVVIEVDQLRLSGVQLSPWMSERRINIKAEGAAVERRRATFPKGSRFVTLDQPLGDLVVQMLEPRCPDSLFSQGFIAGCLQEVEYLEAYVIAPMADQMLSDNPDLRQAFEAELAANPKFAADSAARLRWFYQRSPYGDQTYLLYPISRQPNPSPADQAKTAPSDEAGAV